MDNDEWPTLFYLCGGVSERPIEHAWKACVRLSRTVGSNPTSSDTWDDLTLQQAYQMAHAVL